MPRNQKIVNDAVASDDLIQAALRKEYDAISHEIFAAAQSKILAEGIYNDSDAPIDGTKPEGLCGIKKRLFDIISEDFTTVLRVLRQHGVEVDI